MEKELHERDLKRQAMLDHIIDALPFEGWHEGLISESAEQVFAEKSLSWRLFPGGVSDVIRFWSGILDQSTVQFMQDSPQDRVRDRIFEGVKYRISQLDRSKEAARKTALYLAKHPLLVERLVVATVSEIWYAAGDTSTDYNYYTKRGLLAAVYTSTFAYWLQDTSEHHEKSWEFLSARIDNVLKLPRIPAQAKALFEDLSYRGREIFEALKP